MSYFNGLSNQKSEDSELIKKFVHSGYIDVIHTYGQFSQKGGFQREMAISAIEELKKEGMYVTTWINHGDAHNFQNILNSGWGDLPEVIAADGARTPSMEYHTDLTIAYGIKFVWCLELTPILGQDRHYGIREHYFRDGLLRHPLRIYTLLRYKLKGRPIPLPEDGRNELLTLVTLRDGRKVYTFRRFGCWGKDHLEDLANLLSKNNLERLISVGGYMVTYIHMGKSSLDEILPENVHIVLKQLAKQHHNGKIFVTTTAKLLQYNLSFHTIDWESKKYGNNIEIHIKGIRDELSGETVAPVLEKLSGITFYTPDAERTKVILADEEIDVERNPPDCFGYESVMIPIQWLTYPDY